MNVDNIEEIASTRRNTIIKAILSGDSQVQKFYDNSILFITGGSGFIGKHLIEKLMSSSNIKKMYVLVRPKKGKTIQERLNTILQDPIYEYLKEEQPNFSDKIIPIEGDTAEVGLGIDKENWSMIANEVDIIFNAAATVNFKETIKVATLTNVRGAREVIKLAKASKNLRSLVHVSTAYTYATKSRIDKTIKDDFYESPLPYDALIQLAETVDEDKLACLVSPFLNEWPNSYTLTKAIAEDLVRVEAADLPISIIRPAIELLVTNDKIEVEEVELHVQDTFVEMMGDPISHHVNLRRYLEMWIHSDGSKSLPSLETVVSALQEPKPGWVDNNNVFGPGGLLLGVCLGFTHTCLVKKDGPFNLVPVDTVNNAIIVAAYDTYKKYTNGDRQIDIHTVSCSENTITWRELSGALREKRTQYLVPSKALWYISVVETPYKAIYFILNWILHYIPALIIDGFCLLTNNKPRFFKTYKMGHNLQSVYIYFMHNYWYFRCDKTRKMYTNLSDTDKIIYNFDMSSINMKDLVFTWTYGIVKYILKEDLTNNVYALKKQFCFKIATILILPVYIYSLYKLSFFVLVFLFSFVMLFNRVFFWFL